MNFWNKPAIASRAWVSAAPRYRRQQKQLGQRWSHRCHELGVPAMLTVKSSDVLQLLPRALNPTAPTQECLQIFCVAVGTFPELPLCTSSPQHRWGRGAVTPGATKQEINLLSSCRHPHLLCPVPMSALPTAAALPWSLRGCRGRQSGSRWAAPPIIVRSQASVRATWHVHFKLP